MAVHRDSVDGAGVSAQRLAVVEQSTEVEVAPRSRARDLRFAFHSLCLLLFSRVWLWHTSAHASLLPGAQGFGWFFRYLTFWSLTLQLLLFGVCAAASVSVRPRRRAALESAADTLACAMFPVANTVTLLYYAIQAGTQKGGLVEAGGLVRPVWLDLSVHAANSVVAWADLIVAETRSFTPASRLLAMGIAASYSAWILLVRVVSGRYPYPILNRLPLVTGFPRFLAAGVLLTLALFHVGALLRRMLDARRPRAAAAKQKDI